MAVVQIEGLEKTFKTQGETLTILKNLNMTVSRGEKCVIVGKSGSGKSTLLNIIGGLDSVTSGKVIVNGNEISSLGESSLTAYRLHFLGLVFQFHYLLKDFTALENVFLPLYMAGEKRKTAMEKAKSLLSDVGLTERMNHYPAQLSGGERQRVAVARSLINDPELILADEPTGALDSKTAQEIMDVFKSLHAQGKTVVIVTHDMGVAEQCGRVIEISDGKIIN